MINREPLDGYNKTAKAKKQQRQHTMDRDQDTTLITIGEYKKNMARTNQSSKQTLNQSPKLIPIVDPKPISPLDYGAIKYRHSLKEQIASRREILRSEIEI